MAVPPSVLARWFRVLAADMAVVLPVSVTVRTLVVPATVVRKRDRRKEYSYWVVAATSSHAVSSLSLRNLSNSSTVASF
jgi:hypothetical protein